MEHTGREQVRLHEVIDRQATTRHDKLEPTLRIGEDANILQWISLDDEQIGIGSRSHHAYPPSIRSKRAATVVAERRISAGGCTWWRSVNSLS